MSTDNVQAGIMQNNHVIEEMFQDIITNGTDVRTAAKRRKTN